MRLNIPDDQFWKVRECKCGGGHFEVYINSDRGEVVSGRMSFSQAFRVASNANSELLLAARPSMFVDESAFSKPKGAERGK